MRSIQLPALPDTYSRGFRASLFSFLCVDAVPFHQNRPHPATVYLGLQAAIEVQGLFFSVESFRKYLFLNEENRQENVPRVYD